MIAQASHTGIYFDAEESWMQQSVDDLVIEMMSIFNREKALIYNTYQMYRHDRLDFLKKNHRQAQKEGYILGAKLVRGAYMEKERERALQKGYPSPIQKDKESTDADFNTVLAYCIDHIDSIAMCNASHNEDSAMYLCQLINDKNIDKEHPHVYFAQLYGMGDHISYNLAKAGYNVAKYLPYGKVKDVVPYLIRRANENTSVSGQSSRELKLVMKELERRKESK